VKHSNGLNLWFIDGECREMGRENKEVGTMPTCYCVTFMCCQPCLPTFSVFKVVYHEHPFAFSPATLVMP